MSITIRLTPELESFAQGCVASGRFGDVDEVFEQAMRLLREAEERRAAFVASLEEARAESDRDGYYTREEVETRLRATIAAARSRRG
jgi:antitoxin ParD1/3/4